MKGKVLILTGTLLLLYIVFGVLHITLINLLIGLVSVIGISVASILIVTGIEELEDKNEQ